MCRIALVLTLFAVCSCDWRGKPADPLAEARQLAAAGQYEKALEKHLWIHNHSLDDDLSYAGVRASYALDEWVKLGAKHPPALHALRKIRDEKTQRVLAGGSDPTLFADVLAIHDALGTKQEGVELFRKLDAEQPAAAAAAYTFAERALIGAGEYALVRKYLGDLMTWLADKRKTFESCMANLHVSKNPESFRRNLEELFTRNVTGILTVLDKSGDRPAAKQLQTAALEVLDSPRIRNALAD